MFIPLLDFVGSPLIAATLLLLAFLQYKFPLRSQHFKLWPRWLRNFLLGLPAFIVLRLALIPIPLAAAAWAEQQGFGILNWLTLPAAVGVLIGIALLDYAYYWWHNATHLLPWLWRFHNVHHTDLDMDVSTAVRFHFGELLLSVAFRVAVVVLAGIAPLTVIVFEIVFEICTQFHHSNWKLPRRFENALNFVIVTPRMHGLHHSIVQREANSNWGTIFSFWDRLHRTLRRNVPQSRITIGVPAYRDEVELTLRDLLALPFRKQRNWRLPSGEIPRREKSK